MKLKLTIAYFGQRYHGWQRQRDLPTVQQAVEESATRVFKHPLDVVGASRTDSGVHAEGQVAHLVCEQRIPLDRIPAAMNSRLPTDIEVRRALPVPDDFDARRHACWKLYRYRVHNATSRPIADWGRVYHYWREVDDERMQCAAGRLVGTHDFAALAHASSQPRETTVRTIYRLDVIRDGAGLDIEVIGDGFLYRMVRNVVGTLLDVGRGHREPGWIDELLAGGAALRARNAPPSAPPQGLTLVHISYLPYPQFG